MLDKEHCCKQLNDILSIENRMRLCNLTRAYYVPLPILFVQDVETQPANLYSFQYSGEQPTQDVAILCPAPPSLYLRLDDLTQNKKIKITFAQTPVDSYTYRVDILDYLYLKRAGEFILLINCRGTHLEKEQNIDEYSR